MRDIITVTLNPSIDVTLVTDGLDSNKVNRVISEHREPGGKGINVSTVLRAFEVDSLCLCLAGRSNADELSGYLEKAGIWKAFIEIDGAVRENITVCAGEQSLKINRVGPEFSTAYINEVKSFLHEHVKTDDIVIFAGSLLKNMSTEQFIDIILSAKSHGALVTLDCDCLTLEQYRQISPWLIKPNIIELRHIFPGLGNSISDVAAAARELVKAGVTHVLVSMGKDGLVYAWAGGINHIITPDVPVKSTVGAGDSTLAGFIIGNVRGQDPVECAKLAVACGTATATLEGTQLTGQAMAEEFLKQIRVQNTPSNY